MHLIFPGEPSDLGLHAECGEEPRLDECCRKALRLALAGHVDSAAALDVPVATQVRKCAALRTPVVEIDRRHRGMRGAGRRIRRPDTHESIGLGEGERLHEDAVHHAEDRGVGADAQSERQERRDGERWCAAELSQRVHDVASQFSHVVPPPSRGFGASVHPLQIAAGIFQVAELPGRLGERDVGRQSTCSQLFRAHGDVEAELVVDVFADAPRGAPWQAEELPGHAGASTLPTAST